MKVEQAFGRRLTWRKGAGERSITSLRRPDSVFSVNIRRDPISENLKCQTRNSDLILRAQGRPQIDACRRGTQSYWDSRAISSGLVETALWERDSPGRRV